MVAHPSAVFQLGKQSSTSLLSTRLPLCPHHNSDSLEQYLVSIEAASFPSSSSSESSMLLALSNSRYNASREQQNDEVQLS